MWRRRCSSNDLCFINSLILTVSRKTGPSLHLQTTHSKSGPISIIDGGTINRYLISSHMQLFLRDLLKKELTSDYVYSRATTSETSTSACSVFG